MHSLRFHFRFNAGPYLKINAVTTSTHLGQNTIDTNRVGGGD